MELRRISVSCSGRARCRLGPGGGRWGGHGCAHPGSGDGASAHLGQLFGPSPLPSRPRRREMGRPRGTARYHRHRRPVRWQSPENGRPRRPHRPRRYRRPPPAPPATTGTAGLSGGNHQRMAAPAGPTGPADTADFNLVSRWSACHRARSRRAGDVVAATATWTRPSGRGLQPRVAVVGVPPCAKPTGWRCRRGNRYLDPAQRRPRWWPRLRCGTAWRVTCFRPRRRFSRWSGV